MHDSGFPLSHNPTRENIFKVIEFAKDNGIKVFFDPTLRLEVWNSEDEIRNITFTVLRKCDFAAFSIEAEFFFDTSDPKRAATLALDFGLEVACIKLGSKGAF